MTSREKVIAAFQSIQADLIDYAAILENSIYSTQEDVEIVLEQLNKPTLDDAIKTVESIKKSLPTLTSREEINVYKRVLTALKGLKGE